MIQKKLKKYGTLFSLLTVVCLGIPYTSLASVMLTDSSVFSSNSDGINWNGWIWNTVMTDNPWNLYYSNSSDPLNPTFVNAGNTGLDIEMTAGTHSFLIYGESVTTDLSAFQHFVLNLYFNNNQSTPDISGLYGPDYPDVVAASHWNGLDLFGQSGLVSLNAQEAGTLVYESAGYTINLTKFTWNIGSDVDLVYPKWDDTAPYSSGSGTPDFVGEVVLTVTAPVPEPSTLILLGSGLAVFFVYRKHKVN